MIDSAKNVAFWNKVAQQTNKKHPEFSGMLMDGNDFEAIYRCRSEQKHFLKFCPLKKNMSIIEIGSGGGRWGFFFAEKVLSYTGLDISPEMVKIATEERNRRCLNNINFVCSDFRKFKTDDKFDIVYFSGVLQYMDDHVVSECIKKASVLLKDNGIIISRDTIQTEKRIEKNGEYPAIYRLMKEYADLFKKESFSLQYSKVSYCHKRFTKISNRFYSFPFVSYTMAYILREMLCLIDNILGKPNFLKASEHRKIPIDNNLQEHRFFKYERDK